MFEQDYILRLIKEMIRTLLKLLFNIDTENPTAELLKDSQMQDTFHTLSALIDAGKINEAENSLFDLTASHDMEYLKLALLFYSYLNEKDDAFLQNNHYTREEITLGLKDLTARYGLENITDIF